MVYARSDATAPGGPGAVVTQVPVDDGMKFVINFDGPSSPFVHTVDVKVVVGNKKIAPIWNSNYTKSHYEFIAPRQGTKYALSITGYDDRGRAGTPYYNTDKIIYELPPLPDVTSFDTLTGTENGVIIKVPAPSDYPFPTSISISLVAPDGYLVQGSSQPGDYEIRLSSLRPDTEYTVRAYYFARTDNDTENGSMDYTAQSANAYVGTFRTLPNTSSGDSGGATGGLPM